MFAGSFIQAAGDKDKQAARRTRNARDGRALTSHPSSIRRRLRTRCGRTLPWQRIQPLHDGFRRST